MSKITSMRNKGKVLKTARFYLPETTPCGQVADEVHTDLEEALVYSFGSFFSHLADAITLDVITNELIHDDVMVYNVLVEDTIADLNKLKMFAIEYARKLDQDFVCFENPNGEVYFLDV